MNAVPYWAPDVPAAPALGNAVPGVPSVTDIEVEPGKLLDAARVIEDQANALQDKVARRLIQLHIDPPSPDLVSTYAIEGWNRIVSDGDASYAQRVRAYVQGLRQLADQLRAASERYQQDERARAEGLGDHGAGKG